MYLLAKYEYLKLACYKEYSSLVISSTDKTYRQHLYRFVINRRNLMRWCRQHSTQWRTRSCTSTTSISSWCVYQRNIYLYVYVRWSDYEHIFTIHIHPMDVVKSNKENKLYRKISLCEPYTNPFGQRGIGQHFLPKDKLRVQQTAVNC